MSIWPRCCSTLHRTELCHVNAQNPFITIKLIIDTSVYKDFILQYENATAGKILHNILSNSNRTTTGGCEDVAFKNVYLRFPPCVMSSSVMPESATRK